VIGHFRAFGGKRTPGAWFGCAFSHVWWKTFVSRPV
jgi:hypothetical protein